MAGDAGGALTGLGYSEQAARQALSRSTREGWLTVERHGRRARMSLSEGTAGLLRTGAARIYSFGEKWDWDGRWLVLILRVPEERREIRHQIRARLAWAGLGSLGGGVWVTPHVEREPELAMAIQGEAAADATSFVASLATLGSPQSVARAGWDLETLNTHYAEFITDFARVRPTTPAAGFRMQTLLVHAWRKFPFLDPDLPAELLPNGCQELGPMLCSPTATAAGRRRPERTSRNSRRSARPERHDEGNRAPAQQPVDRAARSPRRRRSTGHRPAPRRRSVRSGCGASFPTNCAPPRTPGSSPFPATATANRTRHPSRARPTSCTRRRSGFSPTS